VHHHFICLDPCSAPIHMDRSLLGGCFTVHADVPECEILPGASMRQHWLACKALTSESSTVNASAADVHQSDAAARPSGATTSTADADSDASWKECGEIPAPEAYAALKLQVQVVRETVVCVQPCVQPAHPSAATTGTRDSCYLFDMSTSGGWFCKPDVARVRHSVS
jgi:hypothetical protein